MCWACTNWCWSLHVSVMHAEALPNASFSTQTLLHYQLMCCESKGYLFYRNSRNCVVMSTVVIKLENEVYGLCKG